MSTTVSNKEDATLSRLLSHMKAVREHWPHVVEIKRALSTDDGCYFNQLWDELSKEAQIALYISPTGGGLWTTREREKMRKFWSA